MAIVIIDPIINVGREIEVSILSVEKFSIKRIYLVVLINLKYYKLKKELVYDNWKVNKFVVNDFGLNSFHKICNSIDCNITFKL